VEFLDGDQKDITYNLLVEHLYSQVDKDGNPFHLSKEIINHWKNKMAINKSDQQRIDKRTGTNEKKKTTANWLLEVEWKNGSTSWLPLK
jgi:hypothetical protein